jgi:hypothetical protein
MNKVQKHNNPEDSFVLVYHAYSATVDKVLRVIFKFSMPFKGGRGVVG